MFLSSSHGKKHLLCLLTPLLSHRQWNSNSVMAHVVTVHHGRHSTHIRWLSYLAIAQASNKQCKIQSTLSVSLTLWTQMQRFRGIWLRKPLKSLWTLKDVAVYVANRRAFITAIISIPENGILNYTCKQNIIRHVASHAFIRNAHFTTHMTIIRCCNCAGYSFEVRWIKIISLDYAKKKKRNGGWNCALQFNS